MGRKLGCVMILLALALPACAAGKPGAITGYVRNSAGAPQMGAAAEDVISALVNLVYQRAAAVKAIIREAGKGQGWLAK